MVTHKAAVISAVASAVLMLFYGGMWIAKSFGETFPVEPGWYRWADQRNSPAAYAPPEMGRFDLTSRCLCSDGFIARRVDTSKFVVITAPPGYSDTVGREFIAGKRACFNCAD